MGRVFASDLRARRLKLSKKSKDLPASAILLQKARTKAPDMRRPTGLKEDIAARSAKFRAKAEVLDCDIRLQEVSVFTYTKKKGDKSYRYWKA
jgi:hypothetical protein